MTHCPETSTKNWYQETRTRFRYQKKLVSNLGLHDTPQETGTGFLVLFLGTGLWIVCHGPKSSIVCAVGTQLQPIIIIKLLSLSTFKIGKSCKCGGISDLVPA